MGTTNHSTPEIAIWSSARGLYHACCDCEWDDKPRWFRFRAIDRAWDHAARTGHDLADPLIVDPLSEHWPPRQLIAKLRRLTPWPVITMLPLLLIVVGLVTR